MDSGKGDLSCWRAPNSLEFEIICSLNKFIVNDKEREHEVDDTFLGSRRVSQGKPRQHDQLINLQVASLQVLSWHS
jgi:hypothetical protein